MNYGYIRALFMLFNNARTICSRLESCALRFNEAHTICNTLVSRALIFYATSGKYLSNNMSFPVALIFAYRRSVAKCLLVSSRKKRKKQAAAIISQWAAFQRFLRCILQIIWYYLLLYQLSVIKRKLFVQQNRAAAYTLKVFAAQELLVNHSRKASNAVPKSPNLRKFVSSIIRLVFM